MPQDLYCNIGVIACSLVLCGVEGGINEGAQQNSIFSLERCAKFHKLALYHYLYLDGTTTHGTLVIETPEGAARIIYYEAYHRRKR